MTNERAAEILNPTHYEDYDSLETVQEACRMVEIMEQKLARWKYRLMKKEEVDVPEE